MIERIINQDKLVLLTSRLEHASYATSIAVSNPELVLVSLASAGVTTGIVNVYDKIERISEKLEEVKDIACLIGSLFVESLSPYKK